MKNYNIYAGYRYPVQNISHAVCFYLRFTLSLEISGIWMRCLLRLTLFYIICGER